MWAAAMDLLARGAKLASGGVHGAAAPGQAQAGSVAAQMAGIKLCEASALLLTADAAPPLAAGGWRGAQAQACADVAARARPRRPPARRMQGLNAAGLAPAGIVRVFVAWAQAEVERHGRGWSAMHSAAPLRRRASGRWGCAPSRGVQPAHVQAAGQLNRPDSLL